MKVSHQEAAMKKSNCPNLVEWTGWSGSFCRLRYRVPDILTSSEIEEFCKNTKFDGCAFYSEELKRCSEIHG